MTAFPIFFFTLSSLTKLCRHVRKLRKQEQLGLIKELFKAKYTKLIPTLPCLQLLMWFPKGPSKNTNLTQAILRSKVSGSQWGDGMQESLTDL